MDAESGARALLKLMFSLATATVSAWAMAKVMRSVMDRPSACDDASKEKLGKILGVSARKLRLNAFELQLTSKLLCADDINVTMEDVAGLDAILAQLRTEHEFVKSFPGASSASGLSASKGVLLYGPPGTGKTMIAKAFAKANNAVLINVTASALFSKWVGESNKLTSAIFGLARVIGNHGRMTVIFLDEVDAILGDGGNDSSHEHTLQVKTEFMQLWDGIEATKNVVVVGATNRPDRLNDAIWRRFSIQLQIPLPQQSGRLAIMRKKLVDLSEDLSGQAAKQTNSAVLRVSESLLDDSTLSTVPRNQLENVRQLEDRFGAAQLNSVLTKSMHPLHRIAELTEGYNGSDLFESVKTAARHAWQQRGSAQEVCIKEADLLYGIAQVKAAAVTARVNETRRVLHRQAHGAALLDAESAAQTIAFLQGLAQQAQQVNRPNGVNGTNGGAVQN